MKTARQLTEEFQIKKLKELLNQCTESQQALFEKCYPHGVDAKDLIPALDLVIRTLKANHPNGS